jgi:hypothetical protein
MVEGLLAGDGGDIHWFIKPKVDLQTDSRRPGAWPTTSGSFIAQSWGGLAHGAR